MLFGEHVRKLTDALSLLVATSVRAAVRFQSLSLCTLISGVSHLPRLYASCAWLGASLNDEDLRSRLWRALLQLASAAVLALVSPASFLETTCSARAVSAESDGVFAEHKQRARGGRLAALAACVANINISISISIREYAALARGGGGGACAACGVRCGRAVRASARGRARRRRARAAGPAHAEMRSAAACLFDPPLAHSHTHHARTRALQARTRARTHARTQMYTVTTTNDSSTQAATTPTPTPPPHL
eukprot:6213975-Pleurochrysis_carterae.AAC.1